MDKSCLHCGKVFSKRLECSNKKWSITHYCSRACYWQNKKGKTTWNKGLTKETDQRVAKLAETKTGIRIPKLQGENVGYRALHSWVIRCMGKADRGPCTHCGSSKNIHWANKSKEYKRDLTDWMRLCARCHFKYDEHIGNPRTYFRKGHIPWHKGKKTGLVPDSAFKKGHVPWNKKDK